MKHWWFLDSQHLEIFAIEKHPIDPIAQANIRLDFDRSCCSLRRKPLDIILSHRKILHSGVEDNAHLGRGSGSRSISVVNIKQSHENHERWSRKFCHGTQTSSILEDLEFRNHSEISFPFYPILRYSKRGTVGAQSIKPWSCIVFSFFLFLLIYYLNDIETREASVADEVVQNMFIRTSDIQI